MVVSRGLGSGVEGLEGVVEERDDEKCCWILSRRWRGLVGLAGAGAGGRCWLASVTKLCLHGADVALEMDNCSRRAACLAGVSLSSACERCMQMVFIR
jgi:hypothetical protein